jgi:hypothetical protein
VSEAFGDCKCWRTLRRRNLKARYAALCDNQYADGIASLFTEDAVWESPALGRFEGRNAIRNFFRGASGIFSFAIHYRFESTSLHRRVRELSVPPETKSDQNAKPRHSIPGKQSLIKPDSLACHNSPRRWCGCEKSAAFVSVLDGDGHWVEYNDPVFQLRAQVGDVDQAPDVTPGDAVVTGEATGRHRQDLLTAY